MRKKSPEARLLEIVGDLSDVPFEFDDQDKALKRITELGKEAMKSHTCTLAFVDLNRKVLNHIACASSNADIERFFIEHTELPIEGYLDFDVVKTGALLELYDLQKDGQGVANPEIAKQYGFNSLLGYPLRLNGSLIGYINHFSSQRKFTPRQERLIEIFAHQAMLTIEKLDQYRSFDRSLSILNDLSESLLRDNPNDFLQTVAQKACDLLSVPICIVWKQVEDKLRIAAATDEVDKGYRQLEIDPNDDARRHFSGNEVSYVAEVSKAQPRLIYSEEIERRGWVSLLTAPLRAGTELIGVLDVFTREVRQFRKWEKEIFETFANHAALSFQKVGLLKETKDKRKLEKLSEIMLEMSEKTTENDLLRCFLKGGLELVGVKKGLINRLNYTTGNLDMVALEGDIPMQKKLKYGEGLTGKALLDEEPVRADNVKDPQWKGIYEEFWRDTNSEMTIPILLNRARIIEGKDLRDGLKPIGVLNIESTRLNAFSQTDEDCLLSLARYAALMIDRLESEGKSGELREVEDKIINETNHNKVLMDVSRGIRRILGFDYVNILLVIPEQYFVRSEYVDGIKKHDIDRFKQMAVYSLTSNFIYADIVRSGDVEVPDAADERLDRELARQFRIDDLLRVFVPMIEPSTKKVIGVVEAGYRKTKYRKHIYEGDVRMLKEIVDYAAEALQQEKKYLLEQITHELRAPVVGLRSNASFLERRLGQVSEEQLQTKLSDMLVDSTLLSYQVDELEYFLGVPRRPPKLDLTMVYRDVIIKVIQQLKPVIIGNRLDPSRVEYNRADSHRILVLTDITRLNQVVFNLLINSIKYAEKDPAAFRIRIEVEEDWDDFTIKFQDWGIGIDKEFSARIFERGFRTPQAKKMNLNSSGLGLTISRAIMRDMGGDLMLASNHKPTEFQLILPKKK